MTHSLFVNGKKLAIFNENKEKYFHVIKFTVNVRIDRKKVAPKFSPIAINF